MRFAYRGRFGKLAILLALCAGFAPRASAQARGQADGPPDRGGRAARKVIHLRA
jgi:hypothetical protein